MMRFPRHHDDDEIDDDDDDEGSSGNDSDIQEIAVIPASSNSKTKTNEQPYPSVCKRRKSSPLMDPIPTYEPTPIHILEQRARERNAQAHSGSSDSQPISHGSNSPPSYNSEDLISPSYTPTPIAATPITNTTAAYSTSLPDLSSTYERSSHRHASNDDYVPLLRPTPSVVGVTHVAPQVPVTRSHTMRTQPYVRHLSLANRTCAVRPVSSALAQAVARRRNSRLGSEELEKAKALYEASKVSLSPEEPVMWSPKPPPQKQPQDESVEKNKTAEDEEYEKYKSPRITKQRIAHKPTIPTNRSKRPRVPSGVAKKVPASFRVRYLDVIIDEYLKTGHPEDESYQDALKEEESIATRAANKSIYINLVAGLKKKIREKAGISSSLKDDSTETVNGNKVVSHSEILTGKVQGTFSIERKKKNCDPSELNEFDLYDRLLRYTVPIEVLEDYGYPTPDQEKSTMRKVPLGKDGQKLQLREQIGTSYTCERCTKVYRVDDDGMPLSTTGKCIYHPGHLWNERINRALEKRYSCCKGDPSAGGCSSNPYHVHKGELEKTNYDGFVETRHKPDKEPNKHGIYALDCEMCYTTHGLELTRVTVINYKFDVVYEKLVKPLKPILDYNTKFSGIKAGDLDDVNTTLSDVQKDLLKLFSSKSLLIGHSLDSDMKALKLFHKRFIDTAQLFPHKRGLPFKRALRTLMVENLQVIIQDDIGHDSKEDAAAAFRLVMWKAKTDVPEKTS